MRWEKASLWVVLVDEKNFKILANFIKFTDHLIVIPKTQYILQNVINVGNNTLAVLKL